MNGRAGLRWFLVVLWLAVWAGSVRAEQPARPPILEAYSFTIGETTDGTSLRFHDDAFGNGTAKCDITTHSNDDGSRTLWFRVQRRVPPGGIVFALLCSGIKIRCFDSGKVRLRAQPGRVHLRRQRVGRVYQIIPTSP